MSEVGRGDARCAYQNYPTILCIWENVRMKGGHWEGSRIAGMGGCIVLRSRTFRECVRRPWLEVELMVREVMLLRNPIEVVGCLVVVVDDGKGIHDILHLLSTRSACGLRKPQSQGESHGAAYIHYRSTRCVCVPMAKQQPLRTCVFLKIGRRISSVGRNC